MVVWSNQMNALEFDFVLNPTQTKCYNNGLNFIPFILECYAKRIEGFEKNNYLCLINTTFVQKKNNNNSTWLNWI